MRRNNGRVLLVACRNTDAHDMSECNEKRVEVQFVRYSLKKYLF